MNFQSLLSVPADNKGGILVLASTRALNIMPGKQLISDGSKLMSTSVGWETDCTLKWHVSLKRPCKNVRLRFSSLHISKKGQLFIISQRALKHFSQSGTEMKMIMFWLIWAKWLPHGWGHGWAELRWAELRCAEAAECEWASDRGPQRLAVLPCLTGLRVDIQDKFARGRELMLTTQNEQTRNHNPHMLQVLVGLGGVSLVMEWGSIAFTPTQI